MYTFLSDSAVKGIGKTCIRQHCLAQPLSEDLAETEVLINGFLKQTDKLLAGVHFIKAIQHFQWIYEYLILLRIALVPLERKHDKYSLRNEGKQTTAHLCEGSFKNQQSLPIDKTHNKRIDVLDIEWQ